jgi:hypothetical protein
VSADPGIASGLPDRAARPATASRALWLASVLSGGVAVCGLAAYAYHRMRVAMPPAPSAAAALQVAPIHAEPVAAPMARLETARIAPSPSPSPPPVKKQTQPETASRAVAAPKSAPVSPTVPVPTAAPPALKAAGDYEVLRDESIERIKIVASLDRWFNARYQNAGEDGGVTAVRIGEPSIVFDPTGTSASVTYDNRLSYRNSNRVQHSIVEEQVFFARVGDRWEIVDPEGG